MASPNALMYATVFKMQRSIGRAIREVAENPELSEEVCYAFHELANLILEGQEERVLADIAYEEAHPPKSKKLETKYDPNNSLFKRGNYDE